MTIEGNAAELFSSDRKRYGPSVTLLNSHALRFLWALRNEHVSKNMLYGLTLRYMRGKYGLEIYSDTIIGRGLYLGHAFNITINPMTVIGTNVNLHKGVTIGAENRGFRKGAPKIGDKVWIGVNSTVVGKIEIGSDVLIAPNSYVNCDVPDHSIVIGNPCSIVSRYGATDSYVNNIVPNDGRVEP